MLSHADHLIIIHIVFVQLYWLSWLSKWFILFHVSWSMIQDQWFTTHHQHQHISTSSSPSSSSSAPSRAWDWCPLLGICFRSPWKICWRLVDPPRVGWCFVGTKMPTPAIAFTPFPIVEAHRRITLFPKPGIPGANARWKTTSSWPSWIQSCMTWPWRRASLRCENAHGAMSKKWRSDTSTRVCIYIHMYIYIYIE